MLSVKPLATGRLRGSIYDFPVVGDILPMHEHDEETVHITIIARGAFIARGIDWESRHVAGDIMDWVAGDPHEFVSTEPNSRLVNIIRGPG